MSDRPIPRPKLTRRIIAASVLMMAFGAAEIVTSFTHRFFGLTTTEATLSTLVGAIIGSCYFASGLLILLRNKRAAVLAILLLIIDAIGRSAMVLTGLYPVDSALQAFAIVVGTSIVVLFVFFVRFEMRHFSE